MVKHSVPALQRKTQLEDEAMANDAHDLAMQAKAWPFEEARKVLKRIGGKTPEKGYVLFETGYGPSGLPHIGTFGEVLRTSMVRRAFRKSPTSRRDCLPFPTIWTASAACLTTSRSKR